MKSLSTTAMVGIGLVVMMFTIALLALIMGFGSQTPAHDHSIHSHEVPVQQAPMPGLSNKVKPF